MKIGVDLGGTTTAAALVDDNGRISEHLVIPSDSEGGSPAIVDGIINLCLELIDKSKEKVVSVGIGVPGHVNEKTSEVLFAPNLPINGLKIADAVKEKIGIPIYVGNDANCAAMGELVAGSLRGTELGVFVILGTGVGGGVIINGKPLSGKSGAGGELGHMVIAAEGRECGCGRLGCWEAYSNSAGLAATANEIASNYPESQIWQFCNGEISRKKGKEIFNAYRCGDYAARLIIERYISHLAIGVTNIISIFEPEIIAFGGGISNAWDCLESGLIAAIDAEKKTWFSDKIAKTRIVKAILGDEAGIIGAANLA